MTNMDSDIYDTDLIQNDLYLIHMKTTDYMGNIIDIDEINNKISLHNNDDDTLILEINDDNKILLKTKKYEIIDIEKIIEFDDDEFDDITTNLLKQDVYPELEIETEEISFMKYDYTKTERKEILLSELIVIYKNTTPSFLKELSNNIDDILLIADSEYIDNYKTKDFINNNLSDWMLPIFDVKPKIYTDELLYEDINEIENLKGNINYFKYLNVILNNKYFAIIYNEKKNGYNIDYSGRYFTDCLTSGCFSNNTSYFIDDRRTINEINIPIKVDKHIKKDNIIPKQNMNLISFMTLPLRLSHFYYNLNNNNRTFTLQEKILFNNKKYTTKSFMNYIKDNYDDIRFKNLETDQLDINDINVYDITNKQYNEELLLKDLNNLPNVKDIIDTIKIPLYNYSDVERLLTIYNININNFTPEDIKYINNRIRYSIKGIKQDIKNIEPVIYDKEKIKIDDRIKLIKEYIFKQTDIQIQNYYLNQFIEKFTKTNKDDNWLYAIHNNEKTMCKHYMLSSKILYDKNIYGTLISLYGTEPTDGIIYCKNCGEYISPENFTITEEFDDGGIIMKSIIEDDQLDILEKLSDPQLIIVERIKLFSFSLGVELNNKDVYEILINYELLKNDEFANIRYDKELVSTSNHPIIIEALNKNLTNTKLKTIIVNTQKYLIYSNQLIYLYIIILIYIQTSIPEYTVNSKSLELIDLSNKSYETMNVSGDDSSINMSVINNLMSIIRNYTKNYKFEDFWKYSQIFLNEYDNIKSVKPEIQIINCIKYVISPYYSKILDRINTYNKYNDTNNIGYIKKYWITYNPNPNNKDILKINNIVQNNKNDKQYLIKKNVTGYNIENIIDITPINRLSIKYKQYNINVFELLTIHSFKKLYIYIINLYGNSDNMKYIYILINDFKNKVSNKKTNVISILKKYNFDQLNLNKKTSYTTLKRFIYDINKLYSKTDNELVSYDHIVFNSPQCKYIKTLPIRHYYYNAIKLYSDKLITGNTNKLLSNKFCYDKYGKIIYNDSKVHTQRYLTIDLNVHLSNFNKNIETDNIYKTIYNIHKQNILELLDNKFNHLITEKRLVDFINRNKIDNDNINNISVIINNFLDNKKINYNDLLKKEMSNIIKSTKSMIQTIIDFINKSPLINKYLKNIKLDIIFKEMIETSDIVFKKNSINSTNMLITIISKNINVKKNIPKYWMKDKYNSDLLMNFLTDKRYSVHNDMFVRSSEKLFLKYFDKSDYFINLHKYTQNITNDYSLLIGMDNTYFTEKYGVYIQRFIFVNYLHSIVNYIENISLINNDMPNMDNILYELLENNNKDNIDDSINILSQFFIDIITNMIQEYTDPLWIYNKNKSLSDKLGIQKEREKQSLIQKLDVMTPEERLLAVQKQNYGISNWYQAAAQENQDYINSDEYKNATDQERIEYINEIKQSNTVETDVLSNMGLNNPDINFQKPNKPDGPDYDEYSFNDGDVEGDHDLDGFDRNAIDD